MEREISSLSPAVASETMHPITVIQCEECKSLGFSCLAYAEAEALICQGSVSRYCRTCLENTMWRRLDILPPQSNLNVA
ncbi:MAG TPA: hypothetical protein VKV95_07430 [Terriglobia bacterium]|nr:hypothetical protein [Terriglobia bacterium]